MRTYLHRAIFLTLAAMAACSGNTLTLENGKNDAAPANPAEGGGSGSDTGAGGTGTTGETATIPGTKGEGGTGGTTGGQGGGGSGGLTGTAGVTSAGGGTAIITSSETCVVADGTIPKDKYAPGYTSDPAAKQRAKEVSASMSLDDKIIQMTGVSFGDATNPQFADIQRSRDTKTVRGFRWRDGSRGVDLGEDYEGTQVDPAYSTAFPVSVARGAAFDLDLEYEVGKAIADEFLAAKQTVLLAPSMNLIRHPFWGRAQESYSEDPYHTGRLASAMVVGIQEYMPANAKYFMGYSIEKDRPGNNSEMEDEQTLREIYGRHFRMAIQDGGVVSVMAAYNKVNGVKCTNSAHLLTDVLRSDFGFQGFVISDWFAMPGYADPNADAPTMAAAAKEAVTAGLDVELPWEMNFSQLKSLVESNILNIKYIDSAVERILEQKFRFKADGLTGPWGLKTPKTTFDGSKIEGNQDHIALAQKAAEMGAVLLKNDNKTLPIAQSAKRIAVLGATVPYNTLTGSGEVNFAKDVRTGDLGSSRVYFDPKKGSSPYDGIKEWGDKNGITVTAGTKASDASDADFVVVVAGLTAQDEGEEYNGSGDRNSLELDNKNLNGSGPFSGQHVQDDLISAAADLKKPMVVVLEGGAPIAMPWLSKVPAVVMAWYPGMVGGRALARLLFGQISFSGKLPVSWPATVDSLPTFNGNGTTKFGYYVGYRYFDHQKLTPFFPFGFGLSYSTFEYRKLRLGCSALTSKSVLPVYVSVANTGSMDADEIVMVFVSFPGTKARRADKELKAFSRVSLKAGEEKEIMIPVRVSDLDYWDNNKANWVIESGDVRIQAGPNSADLPLSVPVRVNADK
jgi:beta-glucosidase